MSTPFSIFLRSITISVVVAAAVVGGLSQIAGGMSETTTTRLGGNNFVAGTVFWPSGTPVNRRLRVKLVSPAAGEVVTSTDERGQFIFSGLGSGSYSIVIDREQDFEPASQSVEINESRSRIPQTYTISIRLVERSSPTAKPTVISPEELKIPRTASDSYRKAVELSNAGDHKAAIEKLKLAIAEFPGYADAYNELGVQYMRLNELDLADAALVEAVKIKPDAFEPTLNRGITLFRLKRYSEAETVLRSAVKIKPSSAVPHYYLGRALTILERFDEAESELNAALSAGEGQMNEAHRMLANLYLAKGDDRRAAESLEAYLKLVPEAPDAEKLRGVIRTLRAAPKSPGKN